MFRRLKMEMIVAVAVVVVVVWWFFFREKKEETSNMNFSVPYKIEPPIVEPVIPAPVGVAEAVRFTAPLVDAFQAHVAVKLDPEPIANLFLQPGNTLPFELKEIFDATVTTNLVL
jgi:hypothetical protein